MLACSTAPGNAWELSLTLAAVGILPRACTVPPSRPAPQVDFPRHLTQEQRRLVAAGLRPPAAGQGQGQGHGPEQGSPTGAGVAAGGSGQGDSASDPMVIG